MPPTKTPRLMLYVTKVVLFSLIKRSVNVSLLYCDLVSRYLGKSFNTVLSMVMEMDIVYIHTFISVYIRNRVPFKINKKYQLLQIQG